MSNQFQPAPPDQPPMVYGRAIGVLAVSWADEYTVYPGEWTLLLTVAGWAAGPSVAPSGPTPASTPALTPTCASGTR